MEEFINRTDTILFGRKSYELLLQTDKNAWATHSRIVFSKTLTSIEGASLVNNKVEETLSRLKQQPGKDLIMWGGVSIAPHFISGLV